MTSWPWLYYYFSGLPRQIFVMQDRNSDRHRQLLFCQIQARPQSWRSFLPCGGPAFTSIPADYNLLLIKNRSWILTIHKDRMSRKKPFEKTFLDFKKWVKNVQTAGYNGASTVPNIKYDLHHWVTHHIFWLYSIWKAKHCWLL